MRLAGVFSAEAGPPDRWSPPVLCTMPVIGLVGLIWPPRNDEGDRPALADHGIAVFTSSDSFIGRPGVA